MSYESGKHRLGPWEVSGVGFGAMHLSLEARPERKQALETIRAAIAHGMTFIDTADAYTLDADGQGHNELLVAEALSTLPEDSPRVIVATKAGMIHVDGEGPWKNSGSPAYLIKAANESRRRLNVDKIDLFQFHRPDPAVPFIDSLYALQNIADEGIAETLGVSNVSVEQTKIAHDVLGDRLVSVQNRFSPQHLEWVEVVRTCESLGIAFLAWCPLGGREEQLGLSDDHPAFAEVAQGRGVSVQEVVLAWERAFSSAIIPIPGSRRPETAASSAHALSIQLEASEMETLNASLGTDVGA
jgi:aryl-alcohol dehydrogenase-like predicted oxidoreductase